MIDSPLEIIQHIITASVPTPDVRNSDRAQFLLPFCRLHSSILPIAQRLLFRHPVVRYDAAFEEFMSAVLANGILAEIVQSLRFKGEFSGGRRDDACEQDLWQLGETCGQIDELWLSSCRRVNLVDLESFPSEVNLTGLLTRTDAASVLRGFFCVNTDAILREKELRVPSLVNLCLGDVEVREKARDLFKTEFFPSLRRLSVRLVDPEHPWDAEFDQIAEQLVFFSSLSTRLPLSFLPFCPSLRALEIDQIGFAHERPFNLGTARFGGRALRSLRLRFVESDGATVLDR